MLRARLTWVIAAAVVVLITVAGFDALRSPDTTPASTTTASRRIDSSGDVVDRAGNRLPDCTSPEQFAVSLKAYHDNIRGSRLTVRPIEACRQGYSYFRMILMDASGKRLGAWSGGLIPPIGPLFVEDDVTVAWLQDFDCERSSLLRAHVTIGRNPAPQGQSFRIVARCL
jgi:hypothetical protein